MPIVTRKNKAATIKTRPLTPADMREGLRVIQPAHPEYGIWVMRFDGYNWNAEKGGWGNGKCFGDDYEFWAVVID
jgi:hypothetical protein